MKVLKYNKENRSDQNKIKNNTQFEISYFCQKMVFKDYFNQNTPKKFPKSFFRPYFLRFLII